MAIQPFQLTSQALIDLFSNAVYTSGGVTVATTDTKIKTVNALQYSIAGQAYVKAATDNIAFTADTAAIPAGTTGYYLFCINAAGTVVSIAPPTARAGNPDTTQLLLGACPDGSVPFAVAKVVATLIFTPGATSIGTGNVVTYANINRYPVGEVTALTFA